MPGSSPRMRGALYKYGLRLFPRQDHPRGCGEHRRSHNPGLLPRRIIPADAGSTGIDRTTYNTGQDHPRGCGEHKELSWIMQVSLGSSPRMRGALLVQAERADQVGIIPADAGSTMRWNGRTRKTRDHPRGCGEHSSNVLSMLGDKGSSPRMRGALHPRIAHQLGPGIIPADAGSTWTSTSTTWRSPDHPRGCGEHGYPYLRFSSSSGSSPRMRGAPGQPAWALVDNRIIPADAGSTSGGVSRHHRS